MIERLRDDNAIAWRPTDDVIARAQLTRFISFCGLRTFDELYSRSVADVEWLRWCVDGSLNIVRSCLDRWEDTPTARKPAVKWEGEEGATRELDYADLLIEVERCAAGLRACGYGRGDAIGIHLPMVPETVIALLAINRIGGIAVPLFSGYGSSAISSRLRDVKAKDLFTCDAFPRRGKPAGAKQVADDAVADCPAITRVIVVRRMRVTAPMKLGRDLTWDQLLATGDMAGGGARLIEPTGAEDPL